VTIAVLRGQAWCSTIPRDTNTQEFTHVPPPAVAVEQASYQQAPQAAADDVITGNNNPALTVQREQNEPLVVPPNPLSGGFVLINEDERTLDVQHLKHTFSTVSYLCYNEYLFLTKSTRHIGTIRDQALLRHFEKRSQQLS
jgi:hypothetical protein